MLNRYLNSDDSRIPFKVGCEASRTRHLQDLVDQAQDMDNIMKVGENNEKLRRNRF